MGYCSFDEDLRQRVRGHGGYSKCPSELTVAKIRRSHEAPKSFHCAPSKLKSVTQFALGGFPSSEVIKARVEPRHKSSQSPNTGATPGFSLGTY